jgi:hypothetical protein
MLSDVLTKEAIANNPEVLGDQSQLLGEAADKPSEVTKIKLPYITVKRGSPFIQTDSGWGEIEDANGEAVVPKAFQGTRFAQWFRFKNARLEWGGMSWNKQTKACDLQPADEKDWLPVRGIPGTLTVYKSEGDSESFFTVENATNTSVWPLIPAREYIGGQGQPSPTMQTFKGQHAILVVGPGRLIHRIGAGTVPGHPCYVCGCMIPGEYDKDILLKDLRSTTRPGIALDRIIECLGGWQENQEVRIIVT